ncbi:MAG TPA: zinc-dependent metalloprotease [Chitinophagales bacterium]|nr:zinc-dependent metalloprotease [Chitinophagales bacterium]
MKHIYLVLAWVLLGCRFLSAQNPQMCGTDELSYQLYIDNPALQAVMESNRAYLKNFTEQYITNEGSRANDSVYTIPVVFHVIHMYGAENVTDEQVKSGLFVLNRNFANQNPDSANIVAAFKPIAANCEIEFKMAQLDPNGNCTNGINRIASPLTKIGDHSVKNLIHWDPAKYLNVYVVRSIANLAGHCLMPDQAAAKPEWDGVVIDDSYLGNIGTSSEYTSVVMAHEVGHYLNLFHIWGGNNVPGYFYQPVGQQANCTIGDDVQDTPPTIGWSNCNLTAASCSSLVDNVQNAMDYSYCNFMFTQGQRQRMRAAVNSPVANRNNLVTPANHTATGINLATVCRAAFTADKNIICYSDSVQFTDLSVTTPDAWLWNFGDNTTSTSQNPVHTYDVPGDYFVTLTASKGATTLTSDSFLIRVNPYTAYPFFVEGFETANAVNETGLVNSFDNGSLRFALSNAGEGFNSPKAAVIRLADTTAAYTGRTVLASGSADMSNAGTALFSLKYACSQKKQNNDDGLEVFISTDCGQTWLSKGRRFGANLRTVSSPQTDLNWVPADSLQWKAYSFNLTGAQAVSNFMFRIEYTSYYTNAFYIDNINLNAAAYTGVPKLLLEDVEIMPNPTTGVFKVTGDFDKLDVQVIDVNGREVFNQPAVQSGAQIDVTHLPQGVYLVRLQNENSYCVKKLLR